MAQLVEKSLTIKWERRPTIFTQLFINTSIFENWPVIRMYIIIYNLERADTADTVDLNIEIYMTFVVIYKSILIMLSCHYYIQ